MEGLWLDQVDAVAQLGRRAAGDAQLEAIGSRMINDGFVVLPAAIAGAECDAVVNDYRRFIDDLGAEVEQHKDASGRLLRVVNFHLTSGSAANIGCNPRLMAILDFLLGDEDLLLAFCAEAGVAPTVPARARAALPGGDAPNWT